MILSDSELAQPEFAQRTVEVGLLMDYHQWRWQANQSKRFVAGVVRGCGPINFGVCTFAPDVQCVIYPVLSKSAPEATAPFLQFHYQK